MAGLEAAVLTRLLEAGTGRNSIGRERATGAGGLAAVPTRIDEVMWVNRYWPMVFKQIVEALGA